MERVEEKQTLLKAGSVLGIDVQNSKSPPGDIEMEKSHRG